MGNSKKRHHLFIVLALVFASTISITLVAMRVLYSDQIRYTFLIWNLFLAWMPLIFSFVAYQWQRTQIPLTLAGLSWLLFFPNALYLVTDLIHLRTDVIVPIWFDAIMLFSFALTGLLIGLLSLFLMQTIVSRKRGQLCGWLFVLTTLAMSSYGVYVGRFLRWNSWDVFAHPITILHDILASLIHPQMVVKTYAVSFLLSAIFIFAYLVLFSLPQAVIEAQSD